MGDAAKANIAAIAKKITNEGLKLSIGWGSKDSGGGGACSDASLFSTIISPIAGIGTLLKLGYLIYEQVCLVKQNMRYLCI